MPQINQLADAAYSQFFWLLLVLAILYFGIGRMMLPKVQSTVEMRDQRIAGDLAAAQAAREAAEGTEAAYRARMDSSRAEGLKSTRTPRCRAPRHQDREAATGVGGKGRRRPGSAPPPRRPSAYRESEDEAARESRALAAFRWTATRPRARSGMR